jgi:hypothetical protein
MTPFATIWRADSPLARCVTCGVHQQYHSKSDVPYSADRDHPFVAETIADLEPADLNTADLVNQIHNSTDETRVAACREVLRNRMQGVTGVDWESLAWSLAA